MNRKRQRIETQEEDRDKGKRQGEEERIKKDFYYHSICDKKNILLCPTQSKIIKNNIIRAY